MLRAGYLPRLTGENIAFGPESAEEVVAGWMDSPGHCANIMDARFEHIGVGLATGRGRGRIYWVRRSARRWSGDHEAAGAIMDEYGDRLAVLSIKRPVGVSQ